MTVLFVITTIIIFLLIDFFYNHLKERKEKTQLSSVSLKTISQTFAPRVPEGIFFTKSHSWLNLFPSGKIYFGADDFVMRLIDKPTIHFLKNPGDRFKKNEPLLRISDGIHNLTIRSPLDGEIITANENLVKHPDTTKASLFSEGWMYSIKPNRIKDLTKFLLGTESKQWMLNEYKRLKEFLMGVNPDVATATLQDGGFPTSDAMKSMNSDCWKKFEEAFLQIEESETVNL